MNEENNILIDKRVHEPIEYIGILDQHINNFAQQKL
jgi:hypothetical protein